MQQKRFKALLNPQLKKTKKQNKKPNRTMYHIYRIVTKAKTSRKLKA